MHIKKLTSTVIKNKIIIVRVDFNVPLSEGNISENTRIIESLPTIKYLLDNGAKRIHLLSHMGRPKGEKNLKYSLLVIKEELQNLLEETVEFRKDFTIGSSRIQLHENLRFWEGETKNDPQFIQQLLSLGGEVFINDGFAVCHRSHSSVVGLANFLPSYPGFLLKKEIDHLAPYVQTEKMNGLSILIGGVKIDTKINVLKHFALSADNILIGGALANTFLAAQGYDIGASLCQNDKIDTAREILELAEQNKTGIHLPIDVICSDDHVSKESIDIPIEDVEGNMQIFDIGIKTIISFSEILRHSKAIIWNGPLGMYENKNFSQGTKKILKIVSAQKSAKTILGGGDTLDALKKFALEKTAFTHVSTGGGAMLEFLEGKSLPGIEVLQSEND